VSVPLRVPGATEVPIDRFRKVAMVFREVRVYKVREVLRSRIASTALYIGAALVSADKIFNDVPGLALHPDRS